MYSWVMKYSPLTTPKSKTGTMFECTRPACMRASSMNWLIASLSLGQLGAQPLEHEHAREALDARRDRGVDVGHAALAQLVEQLVAAEDLRRRLGRRRRRAPSRAASCGGDDTFSTLLSTLRCGCAGVPKRSVVSLRTSAVGAAAPRGAG